MQDQLLTCQNCGNPFVYSVYEQLQHTKKSTSTLPAAKRANLADSLPIYCPICESIKANESKHPPKPPKVLRS